MPCRTDSGICVREVTDDFHVDCNMLFPHRWDDENVINIDRRHENQSNGLFDPAKPITVSARPGTSSRNQPLPTSVFGLLFCGLQSVVLAVGWDVQNCVNFTQLCDDN